MMIFGRGFGILGMILMIFFGFIILIGIIALAMWITRKVSSIDNPKDHLTP